MDQRRGGARWCRGVREAGFVAFARGAGSETNLMLYDIEAGTTTDLTPDVGGWVGTPIIDGGYVAFYHSDGFRLYELATGITAALAISTSTVRFEGGKLLWLSSTAAHVYDVATERCSRSTLRTAT